MFYKAPQVIPGLSDECRYNRYGLVVSDLRQHNKTGMTFYEGDDIGVFRALNQVTFPVTWNGSVSRLWWPFDDRYRVRD